MIHSNLVLDLSLTLVLVSAGLYCCRRYLVLYVSCAMHTLHGASSTPMPGAVDTAAAEHRRSFPQCRTCGAGIASQWLVSPCRVRVRVAAEAISVLRRRSAGA